MSKLTIAEVENTFQEIVDITNLQRGVGVDVSKICCKVTEETGEFAQVVNKLIGMKVVDETPQQLLSQLTEEAADIIQNVLSVVASQGIPLEDVLKLIPIKNKKWLKRVNFQLESLSRYQ